jgi:hypothetical protein
MMMSSDGALRARAEKKRKTANAASSDEIIKAEIIIKQEEEEALKVKTLTGHTFKAVYGAKEREMQFWEYLRNVLYPLFAKNATATLDDDKVSVIGCRFFLNCWPTMSFFAPSSGSQSERPLAGDDDEVLVGEVVKGKQYAFNYANRLLKMGDVATTASVHCVLDIGGPPPAGHFSELVGNAIEQDVQVECAICLDLTPIREGGKGLPNYVLRGCSCYTAASQPSLAPGTLLGEDKGHQFHQDSECLALLPKKECLLC